MNQASMETKFLPAERAPREEVLRQHALLAGDPLIGGLLDSSLSLTMILNQNRQAVLINEPFRARLGLADSADAVGSRMGEYLGCIRTSAAPAGCGTTEACRDCGAARAIACALAERTAVKTCRIQAAVCGQDLSLLLRAAPFHYKGEDFIMVSASDLEPEVRRRQLEQIFFHDVLNTASGVQGLLHVMHEADADDVQAATVQKYLPIARRAADTLIDELLCQRDMTAAENGKLSVTREELSTLGLLTNLTRLFAGNSLMKTRTLVVTSDSEDLRLTTDRTLLSRVLVNLIKNALEAVPPGMTVTVSCKKEGSSGVFLVHNPTWMPPEVQHQLFQRSYSTKGVARGFGTYSIRLLTENYLGCKVSFTSDPAQGTTFRAQYPLAP